MDTDFGSRSVNAFSALSVLFAIFYYSHQRRAGRPQKTISKELLETLLMLKVPISGVASFFEVSRPFVYKAIRDYGIEYRKFTDLSDSRLEEIVASVKENHRRAGEVMLQGHLRAQGLHVQLYIRVIPWVQRQDEDHPFVDVSIWFHAQIIYGT